MLFVRAGTGIVPPVVVWARRTVPVLYLSRWVDAYEFRSREALALNRDGACTTTAGCGPTGGRALWDDLEAVAK